MHIPLSLADSLAGMAAADASRDIAQRVRQLLLGVGELPDREGLRDTPKVCAFASARHTMVQACTRPSRWRARTASVELG